MNLIDKAVEKMRERKELEKTVIEQDLLAQIIKLGLKGEPYTYNITIHSAFEEPVTRKFEITAKEIK